MLVTGGWGVHAGQGGASVGAPDSSSPSWHQAPGESKQYVLFLKLVLDVLYVPQSYRPTHRSEMSQAWVYHEDE